jgi:predicted SprT family Zn-dependent metalloprotease
VLQLSFEFEGPSPPVTDRGAPDRPQDDLDRAYERASGWSRALADKLGQSVRLVVTDNRSTMLSAKPKGGRLEVRLHHMFLTAEEDILSAVGDYLGGGGSAAAAVIDRFVEKNRARFVDAFRPQSELRAAGHHHDLRALVDDIARRHFGGCVDVRVTWGKRVQPKRGQRSLQLGTYLPEERLIRIHPVLDQAWVPRYFVEAVVFHEMLHHDMPAVVQNGRRHYHTAAFRKRERSFEYHAAAEAWQKENLWRLLRR